EDVESEEDASALAKRLIEQVQAPLQLVGKEVSVTASIGIALCLECRESAGDLLRNADAAMYSAKADGKGSFRTFKPAMHTALVERLSLKAALQRAVERSEFVVFYQPVVDLRSRRVVGAE